MSGTQMPTLTEYVGEKLYIYLVSMLDMYWRGHRDIISKQYKTRHLLLLMLVRNLLPSNIKLTIQLTVKILCGIWNIMLGQKCMSWHEKIITLQNRAVRLIDNSKFMTHSDPIFLKYNILKKNYMVDIKQCSCLSTQMASYQIWNVFKKLGNFDRS